MSLPLAGLTVIALEQAVAGPFASRQLADLGARVIKIERDSGDFARRYDVTVRGESSYFVWLNRGKESVVLDLKKEEDFGVLRQMVMTADVLIQNLAPGALDRLGLSAEAALDLNPRLIYTSISGYGADGPYSRRKAYDLLVQCESGMLSVTGTSDEPAKAGISIADVSAGMYAFSGILTALLQRSVTGEGDILEISMLEAMTEWMAQPLLYTMYSNSAPPRSGAHHASIAPYGPFDTADGTVFLAVQNDREWARFASKILGAGHLADDERFASNTSRVVNRVFLHDAISSRLGALATEEVERALDGAGIAHARLRSMMEVAEHPQLRARDRWRTVHTSAGEIAALLPPVTSRSFEYRMGDVPTLGQHTDAVGREFARTSGGSVPRRTPQ